MAEVDSWSDVEIPEPFVRFFRAEYPAVVTLVYGLSGSRAAAEDVAQEAFLRAHRDWRRVEAMDSPEGWIRRVAINLATSRWRRLRAEASAFARLSPPASFVPPDEASSVFWEEVRRLPSRQAKPSRSLIAVVAGFLIWEMLALVLGNQPNSTKILQLVVRGGEARVVQRDREIVVHS